MSCNINFYVIVVIWYFLSIFESWIKMTVKIKSVKIKKSFISDSYSNDYKKTMNQNLSIGVLLLDWYCYIFYTWNYNLY